MTDSEKRKDRDSTGRFVKGHKVPSPRKGRPARGDVLSVLIAVTEVAYTPEQLVDMLRETYDKANANDETKVMLEVIRLVLAYSIGKPVQRSLTASVDPNMLRDILRQGIEEDEPEPTTSEEPVEGEWREVHSLEGRAVDDASEGV